MSGKVSTKGDHKKEDNTKWTDKKKKEVETVMRKMYIRTNPLITLSCVIALLFGWKFLMVIFIALLWTMCAPEKLLHTMLILIPAILMYLMMVNTVQYLYCLAGVSVLFEINYMRRFRKEMSESV